MDFMDDVARAITVVQKRLNAAVERAPSCQAGLKSAEAALDRARIRLTLEKAAGFAGVAVDRAAVEQMLALAAEVDARLRALAAADQAAAHAAPGPDR